MDNKQKEELTTLALLGTGLLTNVALLQSMGKSKTLTIMVLLGLMGFGSFVLMLWSLAP